MHFSTFNISFLITGLIFGLITLPVGQLIECDAINIAYSVTKCANGERVSYLWNILSALIMVGGISYWLLSNNSTSATED